MALRTAIQGQEASFHDIAARQIYGENIDIVPCETFASTFAALSSGEADQAVVAIENSLFGSINEIYDLLLKHRFWICGEVYLRVEQCLIGLQGASLQKITEVHSHPVALAQCEDFLDKKLPQAKRFESHDTASSVVEVKQWGDPTIAAIGSAAAAKLHGLKILAREIETNKQNYTRFVVLQKNKKSIEGTDKTSLVLVTSHQPGSLHKALGVFAKRGINLSKLQSRPIIGQAWHYMFYVDVEVGNGTKLADSLADLKQQDCEATVLGSYKSGQKA